MACPRLERTRQQETILKRTPNTALKRAGSVAKPKKPGVVAERPGSWHLARTETERRLSDFEFGLERLAQAYYRWKAACLAAVCDVPLTGDDVAVLNVVRMGDEPKRLSEIGQLLNRVDVPNLQYATRKLVRSGLIETEGSSSRKETRYRATATGRSVLTAAVTARDSEVASCPVYGVVNHRPWARTTSWMADPRIANLSMRARNSCPGGVSANTASTAMTFGWCIWMLA